MNSNYLSSKPRYEILDGLRGVAAIVVVLYHLMECYPGNIISIYFAHGYLAVDFFFALSGFVLGYAYDDRWQTRQNKNGMTLWHFFKRRLIRLHPMVIFGAIVGVCMFYYTGDIELFGKVNETVWWVVLIHALLMILMIPLPPSMDIRGWGELTSIDGPVWTLMFEYVANILYALFLRYLSKISLGLLVAFCALLTADCCLHLNLWGLLKSDWNSYSVIGGFVFTPEHIYIGYVRLLYPFLIGLFLSRLGKTIKIERGGFLYASLMILAVLCVPVLGGENRLIDGIYQLCCILFAFPLILSIGAGSELRGKKTSRLCIFLGQISFPLYITHYPIIYMHTSWAQRHLASPIGTHIMVGICTLIMSLGLAWAAFKLYDEPVRNWLTRKWLKK